MSKLTGLELEGVDTPSRMTILHPITNMPMVDVDGKEAWIDLYSTDSEVARKFGREMKTARLRERNPNSMTGEKLENNEVDLYAALTAGWYLLDLANAPVDMPFSRSEAVGLYGNHKMAWLLEQVASFASARANFSKASSKN